MAAQAFEVMAEQVVRIVDIAGGQPGDLVAFNMHDRSERFSQARTRVENNACRITGGHRLWTNAQPPGIMFTVTRDTAGSHDLLYTPCCRYALEKRFGVARDGCLENLARSLAPWGIKIADMPDPLNIFFEINVAPDGTMAIDKPNSKAGDYIELRAEMDCIVAISACSAPREGRVNTGYTVEVYPRAITCPA